MIRLLHLFPDLLNLYGDRANLLVLKRTIEQMGAEAKIVKCDDPSSIDFSAYDAIYCGAGTESKIEAAAILLQPVAEKIRYYSENGMCMLFTGSAFELTCKQIKTGDSIIPCLGIFDGIVERTADRQTGDVIYTSSLLKEPIVGFINKSSIVYSNEKPLFSVEFGTYGIANKADKHITGEGFFSNHTIATYVTGPILVKNPRLKDFVAKQIIESSQPGFLTKEYRDEYAENGWSVTLAELTNRKNEQPKNS